MNIKPSNLLLDANGHAMVSDYGLPAILKKLDCRKAQKECESSKVHSCMDCTMLSPNYTAPEAWEPVKKSLNLFWDDAIGISPESDAWSFGCTLVEMCTGSTPYVNLLTVPYNFVVSVSSIIAQKVYISFTQLGWFNCRGNLSVCSQSSTTTSSVCKCSGCGNT